MLYYLIEVDYTRQGHAQAIWEKSSEDEATMALHQTLASAMANTNVIGCLCMVIDECGKVYRNEYWSRTEE